ncbi:hypothetical protein ACJIZ3_019458 [Penstemon smallii]|uniref:Uncharacterized protein n=1 Tax=Penstemon smallii TaxID=265156 RepID=A0ABD3T1Y5_9LAMI
MTTTSNILASNPRTWFVDMQQEKRDCGRLTKSCFGYSSILTHYSSSQLISTTSPKKRRINSWAVFSAKEESQNGMGSDDGDNDDDDDGKSQENQLGPRPFGLYDVGMKLLGCVTNDNWSSISVLQ